MKHVTKACDIRYACEYVPWRTCHIQPDGRAHTSFLACSSLSCFPGCTRNTNTITNTGRRQQYGSVPSHTH